MSLHQELYTVWNNYYWYMQGQKYRWTSRDESHLKNIRQAIEFQIIDVCKADQVQQKDELVLASFRSFLKNIKDSWILAHLELRLIDTKFNSLWANLNRKLPQYYDADFEKRLEKDAGSQAVMKYHQHLIGLGWVKLTNMCGQRWVKPKLNGNSTHE